MAIYGHTSLASLRLEYYLTFESVKEMWQLVVTTEHPSLP